MDRKLVLCAAAMLCSSSASVQAQAGPAAGLPGVWQVIEISTPGPNAVTNSDPQPGLYVFTGRHYSLNRVNSSTPRASIVESTATPDELRAQMQYTAQAGTYEIVDGDIVVHRVVALTPSIMAAGSSATYSYKIEGNTLWLTLKSTSQFGAARNAQTLKLNRVE